MPGQGVTAGSVRGVTDERPEHDPEHDSEHDIEHDIEHDAAPATAGDRTITPATVVAAVIVDELVRAGVREAVVCPGSRSAALALALAEADRTHRLRLHVRTDERSASFLALGMARRSGRPVPVLMTSGTAVANCLPAMVEATASGVPLLILSADRPVSYQGTGANQTIAQSGIFGAHAVDSVSLAAALHDRPDHREVRTVVDRVVTSALDLFGGGVRAGGVQLNVHFVEPLVPGSTADVSLAARIAVEELTGSAENTGTPWRGAARPVNALPRSAAPVRAVLPESPVVTVDLSKRTLVIVGDVRDRTWATRILDTLADVPAIAEPTAPSPGTPVHPAAAGLFSGTVSEDSAAAAAAQTAQLRPEQIVLVGRPTLHRSVSRLLADPQVRVVALTDRDVIPDLAHTVREWGRGVALTGEHPAGWLTVCEAASGVAVDVMQDLLAGEDFTGLHVAAAVTDALRDGDALVLGASSAVRDASLAGLPFEGVWAVSNRGAAGIDGTVSTAVGVALAHASEHPELVRAPRTVALMGDLTVLHDMNGFTVGPGEPRPDNLVVVVSNDDGGAIFETLEAGNRGLRTFDDGADAFDRVFGTPTGVDLGALCEGHGVAHRRVDDLQELIAALDEHAEGYTDGLLVIEAAVQRAPRAALHAALRERTTLATGGRRD
ncbi:2-succinyl-5-enolpyruvyl-6-hydroxy-3-cyclohexene-1-carboxylic-acid synthase [Corynebacterium variabile]|uniref:2-succinyl-5-enolpyruvyl-6-hydroxy-3- cyclohexene-1-carboxylic-acid synthase n=1 Tax=Corynebacterium variabile TaxID=1727 RepID=UPI0035E3EC71